MRHFRLQPYAGASRVQLVRAQARKSGVQSFALVPQGILVAFVSGEAYLYDDVQPGTWEVAQMRELALKGRGLSTFISRVVRHRYRLKLSRGELAALLEEVNA